MKSNLFYNKTQAKTGLYGLQVNQNRLYYEIDRSMQPLRGFRDIHHPDAAMYSAIEQILIQTSRLLAALKLDFPF